MLKNKYLKIKKIVLLLLLIIVLIVNSNAFLPGVEEMERDHGAPTTEWYKVDQWEVDFCAGYGGEIKSSEGSGGRMIQPNLTVSINNIVALQAEYTQFLPNAINKTGLLYELAWFVQPVFGEDPLTYQVWVYSVEKGWETVESDDANLYSGYRGYLPFESQFNYTVAKLKYWNDQEKGEVSVPFVG